MPIDFSGIQSDSLENTSPSDNENSCKRLVLNFKFDLSEQKRSSAIHIIISSIKIEQFQSTEKSTGLYVKIGPIDDHLLVGVCTLNN